MKYKLIFNSKMNSLSPKEKIFFDVGSDGVVKKATVFQNEWIPLAEAEKIL